MELWRLAAPKFAEPMSQFESEDQQAAVEPGRAYVAVWRSSGRRILSYVKKDRSQQMLEVGRTEVRVSWAQALGKKVLARLWHCNKM